MGMRGYVYVCMWTCAYLFVYAVPTETSTFLTSAIFQPL